MTTREAVDVLVVICNRLIPQLIYDLEVKYKYQSIRWISEDIRNTIEPYAPREDANIKTSRKGPSRTLCGALFPERRQGRNQGYEALVALQGL